MTPAEAEAVECQSISAKTFAFACSPYTVAFPGVQVAAQALCAETYRVAREAYDDACREERSR